MNTQEELETLRASESIKHANLQELARLVLAVNEAFKTPCDNGAFVASYCAMLKFAEGVAQ